MEFEYKPNGDSCDDGREYTVDDRCENGLCSGHIVDLCEAVNCVAKDDCHRQGDCILSTGQCVYPSVSDGTPCSVAGEGRKSDKCIEGVCVHDKYGGAPKYLTVGEGQCVDRLGKRMNALQGDEREVRCLMNRL